LRENIEKEFKIGFAEKNGMILEDRHHMLKILELFKKRIKSESVITKSLLNCPNKKAPLST